MNLTISSQTINQYNGLFSLNDLHKVSGGAKKHQPSDFLRNQQTKELITEIESENQIAYHTVQGGNVKTVKQGTYACRELVYAYAMWISAKFSLMVIRAFDALNTGAIPCLPKLSSDDTLPLRNAVNLATGVLKLDYSTIYKMVHQRFDVDEIKDLSREQIGQAVEYVHHLMVQSGHQPEQDLLFNEMWRKIGLTRHQESQAELRKLTVDVGLIYERIQQLTKLNSVLYDAFVEPLRPSLTPAQYQYAEQEALGFLQRNRAMKQLY